MQSINKNKGCSINNNQTSQNMLMQGLEFLRQNNREGFVEGMDVPERWTGTYEVPTNEQSFFSLFSPQAFSSQDPNPDLYKSNINKKMLKLRQKYEASLEGTGALPPTTQKALQQYKYNAEKFAQHFAGLSYKLKKCRKACMENVVQGQDTQKCYRGCQLHFPKWANKQDTYTEKDDGDSCESLSSGTNSLCDGKEYKVNAMSATGVERRKLGQIGKLTGPGSNSADKLDSTPVTGCIACGGGVQGELITRTVDGNYIKRKNDKISACGTDPKCREYKDASTGQWNGGSNNVNVPYKMTNDELGRLATQGNNGMFRSTAPIPDGVDPNTSKYLWDRYDDMNNSWDNLGREIKNAKIVVDTPNNFINKLSSEIQNDVNEDIPTEFSTMRDMVQGLGKTKDQLATSNQRFKDEMIKQKSQYMKNGAFSVLAISLFIFAITKIKGI